ncbi:MAG: NAD(P)/FAD-dependent oxidoreductase [Clostridiales bacterium]|nr:NAD(P)/FAD-dependent oxidoreductase [Clostridiales bacterium]
MKKHIVVIGGGAAGIMAAIIAKQQGGNVTIIEHTNRIGKKILATGNGRCNLTNLDQRAEFYRGTDPGFSQISLEKFGVKETLDFFYKLGLYVKDKNNYIYPYSEQATTVLNILKMELERLEIPVFYETEIKNIYKKENGFQLITTINEKTYCDSLILATGSKAAPSTGSDGSGYKLAIDLGHKLIEPVPALVQLSCSGDYFKNLKGIRTHGKISLYIDNKKIAEDTGELQLTDYGVSGIPVFQISRFASVAIREGKEVRIALDFLPDLDKSNLLIKLEDPFFVKEKLTEEVIKGFLNHKLSTSLIKEAKLSLHRKINTLTLKEKHTLVSTIKDFNVKVLDSKSFNQAQVCAGGISTDDIIPETMESKLVPNLYFAGEILDVDGACGGYNLQWAWTSGYLAGSHAGKN